MENVKNKKKKWMFFLLAFSMSLSLTACGGESEEESTAAVQDQTTAASQESTTAPSAAPPAAAEEGSWAIYWYLCGSDLESGGGFDTCLMATVDVAYTFSDLAHYLVASEETEPANGWYYSQWVGALTQDPSMDGEALGRIICDAYYAGCEAVGTQDNTTLSLTDLSKVRPLLEAYETFGAEALSAACTDPGFFSQFGRVAAKSENYGGNTKEQGYTNMARLLSISIPMSLPENWTIPAWNT